MEVALRAHANIDDPFGPIRPVGEEIFFGKGRLREVEEETCTQADDRRSALPSRADQDRIREPCPL